MKKDLIDLFKKVDGSFTFKIYKDEKSNSNIYPDDNLSDSAMKNLVNWYSLDFEFYKYCKQNNFKLVNMKLIKKNSIPLFSIIFFLFFYFIDISIESTISATILIFVTLFLVTNGSSYEFEFTNIFGFKKFTYVLIILFTTILLQNHYLNFETIDFDIAAYLVTSQDIGNNNLPNEAQWSQKDHYLLISIILFPYFLENLVLLN